MDTKFDCSLHSHLIKCPGVLSHEPQASQGELAARPREGPLGDTDAFAFAKCSMHSRTKKLSQESQSAELSLALLMLRVLANYSDTTFSFDDFAFLANGLYR